MSRNVEWEYKNELESKLNDTITPEANKMCKDFGINNYIKFVSTLSKINAEKGATVPTEIKLFDRSNGSISYKKDNGYYKFNNASSNLKNYFGPKLPAFNAKMGFVLNEIVNRFVKKAVKNSDGAILRVKAGKGKNDIFEDKEETIKEDKEEINWFPY